MSEDAPLTIDFSRKSLNNASLRQLLKENRTTATHLDIFYPGHLRSPGEIIFKANRMLRCEADIVEWMRTIAGELQELTHVTLMGSLISSIFQIGSPPQYFPWRP